MAKVGRNDPCPCGSGKKYKRCCREKEETAARALAAVTPPPNIAEEIDHKLAAAYEDELTTASNAVIDLVHAGKLDEAEKAAHDLLERFPDVHDGYDRLGMVYEARGDHKQAAHYYPKAIDAIPQN